MKFQHRPSARASPVTLRRVTDPDGLDEKNQFRAWLLLTALDANPKTWGIDDEVVPPAYDRKGLRLALVRHQGLEPRTRWLRASMPAA